MDWRDNTMAGLAVYAVEHGYELRFTSDLDTGDDRDGFDMEISHGDGERTLTINISEHELMIAVNHRNVPSMLDAKASEMLRVLKLRWAAHPAEAA